MNIVCLLGSPHGTRGNTFSLANHVLEGIKKSGAKIEVVLLDGMVQPCKGCDNCHRTGRCPLNDGFEKILQLINEADGVLLANPNYIESVSAQLKAFMDRCSGSIHRLAFTGKYGASVVTSGGGENGPLTDYMNRFLTMTGIRPVGAVDAVMAQMSGGEFTGEVRQRAKELGETLVEAWRQQLTDPDTEAEMEAFRERMKQLIVWKKEEWPYEYAYWQEHHGLA